MHGTTAPSGRLASVTHPLARYGIAVGIWAVALGLTTVLAPQLARTIFIFFWPATILAAWFGGLGPGLLATALAMLAVEIFFTAPVGSLQLKTLTEWAELGMFGVLGGSTAAITAGFRRSRARALVAEREMEARAGELQDQAMELEQQQEEAQVLTEELEEANERLASTNEDLTKALALARHGADVERAAIERATNLLQLATALADTTSVDEVARVVIRDAMATVGADAAAFAMLIHPSADGDGRAEFEILGRTGYPDSINARYQRWPLIPGRPLSDAVLSRQPVLLESATQWRARYPEAAGELPDLEYEAMASIPVVMHGAPIAGITFSFREPRRFDEATRTFLATVGEQCGIALGRARAFEAERRARERSSFLSEASRLLATSLEYEETLNAVARAAVPRLADWCAVDIIEGPGSGDWPPRLRRLAVVHEDPAKLRLAEELERRFPQDWSAPTGIARVLRDRAPLFAPSIGDDMLSASARDADHLELLRAFRFRAVIIVPLVARDRTLGALTLIMSESGRRYDAEDLALATALGERAAIAVDNARLFREAERARLQAEEANKAKSDFLARMSHELRTPLNAIAGYSQLIEIGIHGPVTDGQREALRRVQRSGESLRSLIDDVLSFARLESGRIEYDLADVPLDATLAGLEALIGPQLRARGVEYTYRPVDPDITVWADAEKLEQIMLNLLTNAVKFTERGSVTLEGEVRESEVLVHVRDTGTGIPSDKLELIFEPFVQAQAALTRTTTGSGLGLAISRDLARAMGGEVTVESVPGVGSTFTLRLPRSAHAVSPA